MNVHARLLTVALACLLPAGYAAADEVTLNNGDRLTGTVKTMQDGKLVLETAYAGEIGIRLTDIRNIRTDSPVKLVLDDATTVTGVLSAGADGGTAVVTDNTAKTRNVALAQITAVNPPEVPKLKISGQLNGGFSRDRGNTDEDSYHLDGENVFRWIDSRLTLKGAGDLEKTDNRKTKEKANLAIKYDYFFDGNNSIFDDKWYLWSGVNFEHDKFADLDLRTTAGLGPGYQIIENERTELLVEGGPVYVWEQYDSSADQDYGAARWHLGFKHQLFADWKLVAFHNHELRWSLEDGNDYIFDSETGLRVPIFDNVQATVQFNFDRDNAPAPGAKKNDYETLVTGGYTW